MPTDAEAEGPAIPLARWADRQLAALARDHGLPRLDGATLLGERGANGGYRISGKVSAGLGGSRLLPTRDGGWFALTLIREIDRELLPALFGNADLAVEDSDAIAANVARHDCADLVERGRLLGLPVASADEIPASAPIEVLELGPHRSRAAGHRPLVVDLSAIWAGPLAGHLLWQAGMEVVKVESRTRPDLIRRDDPATFDLINQGKASVLVDFGCSAEKARLIDLIRRADIVIESARPRALLQLGIDANALVREVPGLVWLSVTGHGARGEPANWVGIGNDCGVAGGLARAMAEVTGEIGYVGDAIADPLTGVTAAREAMRALEEGQARRIGLSMSAIVAMALAEEQAHDPAMLESELHAWGTGIGRPFPACPRRPLTAPVHSLGADTARILRETVRC
ncbi:CoA transferase [Novosphingobium sp. ST904]|uniref:CoA transferase n=1 Tax=Novosphingobium sp. ST904 TaxID=1684385 RepID=UPI0006C8C40C|nr:CoA transferase [Novosphingobium sp. ST904]KPH58682.1 acyl-CoA transferase [Novosphingobium sp. ST904]TCM42146.1 CoA transferase family III [Novosphingobium sp. ST904]